MSFLVDIATLALIYVAIAVLLPIYAVRQGHGIGAYFMLVLCCFFIPILGWITVVGVGPTLERRTERDIWDRAYGRSGSSEAADRAVLEHRAAKLGRSRDADDESARRDRARRKSRVL